jgi:GT2 family glycosyltransferase
VFQQVRGFDEKLSGAFAAADLCLRMQEAGYLIVYTPLAKLCWDPPGPEGVDANAEEIMRQRWPDVLKRDPYYNPNLSRERADFSVGE